MKMQRQEDGGEGMSLLSGPCQGEIARNPALLLHAIRRVAEAGGELEPREVDFFQACSKGLAGFPLEELTEEFNRILLSPAVFTALQLMVETGLLAVLMPGWSGGRCPQSCPSRRCPGPQPAPLLLVKPQLHLRLAGTSTILGKPDYWKTLVPLSQQPPLGHTCRPSSAALPIPQLVERVRLLVETTWCGYNHGWSPSGTGGQLGAKLPAT